MKERTIRWGILGLGKIARTFIHDARLVADTEVLAVASRSQEKADAFAAEFQVERAYGTYEKLMADPDIDAVYIATPHHAHAACAIACLNAGKHVLCEKPMAVNQSQVRSLIDAAQRNQVFLMEALWTRFNPNIRQILARIQAGELGDLNYVQADFSFFSQHSDESRMFNLDLAGGAMLDLGIYPVFLAYLFMGKPESIQATAHFHRTGADAQTAALLHYPTGIATIMCGLRSHAHMRAQLAGTKGSILIDPRWHETCGYTVWNYADDSKTHFQNDLEGLGFTYEIAESNACIRSGKLESDYWTHQNSLELTELLDDILREIGLVYPFE
ncbi:MAG: Gfo/Idh/MocA family oxidoreductase [Saprospiraceae bacterium]|jgi:predicted dehydrogenase